MLSGDQWTQNLDKVIDMVINDSNKEKPLKELQIFFQKHLEQNFIPYNDENEYESKVKAQVSQWLTFRYNKLLNYFEENHIENQTSKIFDILAELYIKDSQKTPSKALAFLYYQLRGDVTNDEILSDEVFQNSVYEQALHNFNDDKDWAIKVLTHKLPSPHPSHIFTELFFSTIKLNLTDEETHFILRSFTHIIERVDEKLILYDFLEKKLNSDAKTASLAVPYIVDVTMNRSVDFGDFYNVVYRAITPDALSIPGRRSFFETLTKTVTSHDLPKQTRIAFAVKLSRMLPLVSPDVQLDILNVLHSLIKTQQSVTDLLKPMKTSISNVDGDIEDCGEQTLWEVLALQHSSTPVIAEFAKTIGQMVVFPEFESFDIQAVIQNVKPKQTQSRRSSNWTANLEKSLWF